MITNNKAPAALARDRGPDDRLGTANLTATPESHQPAGCVPLRTQPDCNQACVPPLDSSRVLRRTVRVRRSGSYTGRHAEFWMLRCECGATGRVLWHITLPAAGRRAA